MLETEIIDEVSVRRRGCLGAADVSNRATFGNVRLALQYSSHIADVRGNVSERSEFGEIVGL